MKPMEIQIGRRSIVNSDITQTVEVLPKNERFLQEAQARKNLCFSHSQEMCGQLEFGACGDSSLVLAPYETRTGSSKD
uniref:Uncharacterized protein n=1 Tax=Physcomitrium patens TaxID=3218 RepID=A0A2K1IY10_PHYPA|nr:hypothetical protein PHYPA_023975 [Physcomitrium patens]